MKLRKAELSDLPEISSLFLKCWKISYKSVLGEQVREEMNFENAFSLWKLALSSNPERETILGFENGVLVGFFRVGSDKNDMSSGHLFSLYVAPEFARNGFGKQLLIAGIDNIRSRNLSKMSLWVFRENIAAQSLYSSYGFEPTGVEKISPEWGVPEIEMLNTNINLQF